MGDTPSARTPAKEEQANPYDMNGRRSTELGIPAAAHVIRHLPSFTDVPDERGELVRPGTQISQRRHELEAGDQSLGANAGGGRASEYKNRGDMDGRRDLRPH